MAYATVDMSEVTRLLTRFKDVMLDLSPAMGIVAEQLVSAVVDEFMTGGHGRFPPLAPSTLAKRRGTQAQILVDTGRWMGSHQAAHGSTWAQAATDVGYSVYHVSDEPRTVMPLRNPYDLPEEVYALAVETILDWVEAEFIAA